MELQSRETLSYIGRLEAVIAELQLQTQMRMEIEAKLTRIQTLHDTMAHNFPDGDVSLFFRQSAW